MLREHLQIFVVGVELLSLPGHRILIYGTPVSRVVLAVAHGRTVEDVDVAVNYKEAASVVIGDVGVLDG